MKFVDWTLPCVIAALSWGCAGVLDNPEDFREAQEAVTTGDAGGGGSRNDAGSGWRDAGAAGASGAKADAGAAGAAGWDSEDDAGTEPGPADAGAAGSGGAGSGGAGSGAARGGAGSGGAGAGAAAGGGGSGMPDAGPACDFRGLVMMKCAGASCHGGPTASTGLDLTSPSLAMRVQGRNGSGACSDTLLIDRENPEDSALYQRVVGSSCGVRMPLGGTLTAAEQACFLSWIEGL